MALDVYVREDILNVLRALHVSSEVPAALSIDLLQERDLPIEVDGAGPPQDRGTSRAHEMSGEQGAFLSREMLNEERVRYYQKGFHSALASVALAFGLVPVSSSSPGPSPRGTQRCELDLRSFVESMVRS